MVIVFCFVFHYICFLVYFFCHESIILWIDSLHGPKESILTPLIIVVLQKLILPKNIALNWFVRTNRAPYKTKYELDWKNIHSCLFVFQSISLTMATLKRIGMYLMSLLMFPGLLSDLLQALIQVEFDVCLTIFATSYLDKIL